VLNPLRVEEKVEEDDVVEDTCPLPVFGERVPSVVEVEDEDVEVDSVGESGLTSRLFKLATLQSTQNVV